jgi:hypothetical protein
MRRLTAVGAGTALILVLAAVLADVASAGNYGYRGARLYYHDGAIVTAVSRYGNGSISAPIRARRFGWQVRVPRNTWIDCIRSCEETLRVSTVDVFETDGRLVGYGTMQAQCGIFGCLEITFPR